MAERSMLGAPSFEDGESLSRDASADRRLPLVTIDDRVIYAIIR
jgi:hypothetical protein